MESPIQAAQERSAVASSDANAHASHMDTPAAFYDPAVESSIPAEIAGTGPDFRPAVLLVDDNDDLRYVMSVLLETMGYAVVPCCNAQTAFEVFCSGVTFQLLMTDFEMPGKSGVELARDVTALRPTLPVLIVSGSVFPEELDQEISSRNWHFLSKPFDVPTFDNAIRLLLHPHQLRAA